MNSNAKSVALSAPTRRSSNHLIAAFRAVGRSPFCHFTQHQADYSYFPSITLSHHGAIFLLSTCLVAYESVSEKTGRIHIPRGGAQYEVPSHSLSDRLFRAQSSAQSTSGVARGPVWFASDLAACL